MKRVIVGGITAALLLAMLAPALQASQYDPMNPPPWIPLDAHEVSSRPGGDDTSWNDVDTAPPPPPPSSTFFELFGFRLFLDYQAVFIIPAYRDVTVPTDIQTEVTPQQGETRDAASGGH